MQSARLFLAAIIAVLSVGTAAAAECELPSTTAIFKKIDATPSISKCVAASGFGLNPPPAKFTVAQLDKLCALESCRSTVSSIALMKLPSCTISMLNGINLREIFDTITSHCDKKASMAGAKQSDHTTALAAAAAGPVTASPVSGKQVKPPVATKESTPPTAGKNNSPAAVSTTIPASVSTTTPAGGLKGSPSATTASPVSAAATGKPNLRKNCHE